MISLARARRLRLIAEVHTLYLAFIITSFLIHITSSAGGGKNVPTGADLEDNEFAEFEEFDDDEAHNDPGGGIEPDRGGNGKDPVADSTTKMPGVPSHEFNRQQQKEQNERASAAQRKVTPDVEEEEEETEDDQDHEGIVEEEPVDEEYADTKEEDEFENYDKGTPKGSRQFQQKAPAGAGKNAQQQTLKFTDVPAHLVNNWANFQLEMGIVAILVLYLLNYIYGKTKNHSLATAWFEAHRDLLESNFHIVGDDGTQQEPTEGVLMKESDSSYSLWCTGRQGCSGMLLQLKLLKRQDIVSLGMQLFRPKYDRVMVRVNLNADDMDTYVYAFGQKKSLTKLAKDMADLSTYCTEKKNADKAGLPSNFAIYSEIAEVTASLLDNKVTSTVTKFAEFVDYVHISDQFSGSKAAEGETQTRLPDTNKVLIFSFNIPGQLSASERHVNDMRPLMSFVFYMMEKIRRMRLSREAKQKTDKNRQLAAESFLKTTHAQRQEAAQQRREEKARERKERVLAEEDPDKQRRLEKQELKREKKKNQPKVKQLKIKAG